MKEYQFCNGDYWHTPLRFLNFSKFNIPNISIYYGASVRENIPVKEDTNKKVLLEYEQPNFFMRHLYTNDKINDYFDLILVGCPYTCNYLNKYYNTNKYKFIFYPIELNNLEIPTYSHKIFPIFYTGHQHNILCMNIINNVVNKHLSKNECNILTHYMQHNGYYGKMSTFATVKITLAHNILIDSAEWDFRIKDDLMKECYPIDTWTPKTVPQVKSRMFEAAIMKCIILVYKDNSLLIENFYEPGVDFLYYETEDECNQLVEKILQNYDEYKYLAENAFNKTINNYTTKNIVDVVQDFFNTT